jgi:hypothetical protein
MFPITYTLPATQILFDTRADNAAAVRQVSLSLSFPEGSTGLDYAVVSREGVLARIETVPPLLDAAVGDRRLNDVLDRFEPVLLLGRVDWAEGSTVLLDLLLEPVEPPLDEDLLNPAPILEPETPENPGPLRIGVELLVVLDGPPLPEFRSTAEVIAFFELAEVSTVQIQPGEPFGPDAPVGLTTLPAVDIVEPGPASGPVTLVGTPGPDLLAGGAFADALDGLAGADTLRGYGGDDLLEGREGPDRLIGNTGADTLDGGPGADLMEGGTGDDLYRVDDRGDRIVDAGGMDRVETSVAFAAGASGVETIAILRDDVAVVRVFGSAGDETLVGSDGAEQLIGFGGRDVMTGGGGADAFVLFTRSSVPHVEILDFDGAQGDRLAIDDQLLGIGSGGIDIREIGAETAAALLRDGTGSFDRATRTLTLDADGDGIADASVAFQPGGVPSVDEVLIF